MKHLINISYRFETLQYILHRLFLSPTGCCWAFVSSNNYCLQYVANASLWEMRAALSQDKPELDLFRPAHTHLEGKPKFCAPNFLGDNFEFKFGMR